MRGLVGAGLAGETIAGLAAAFGVDSDPAVGNEEYDRLYDIALAEPARVEIRRY